MRRAILASVIARERRAIGLGIALAFAILAVERPAFGQAGQDAQHWLGTWFASSTMRVDQPAAQAQSAPSISNEQASEIPPAVMAVAPSQKLVLAGQSPLHFNNQTLRQIVHVTARRLTAPGGSVEYIRYRPIDDRCRPTRCQRQGCRDRAPVESHLDLRWRGQDDRSGRSRFSSATRWTSWCETSRISRSICTCPMTPQPRSRQ